MSEHMKTVVLGLLVASLTAACTAEVAAIDPDDPDFQESALTNNEATAFNYFVSKGLTKVQAAGIVGNLMQESSVLPGAKEYGGGPGRGIAQWSVGGRYDTSHNDNLTSYASTHGGNRATLGTQLDFIWYELQNFSQYGLSQLQSATTVTAAVAAFQSKYEICGTCAASKRLQYANEALAAYGGSSGGGGGGGGGSSSGDTCYSATKNKEMPENSCVQAKSDGLWYQCSNGSWVDRWSDPTACSGVFPL